jgi:CheY-like chemotaxis protein
VVSTPREGSTFTVFLPGDLVAEVPTKARTTKVRDGEDAHDPSAASITAVAPAPAPAPGRHPPLDDKPFNGLQVLVVDDDFRNIFAMTALLERGSAEVTVAENGPEAITALEQNPDIDLVLMDIMMPGMDGYATIRAIRALPRFEALPIIAVTGKVVSGERQRCLDAGANDYVPKPVDTVELLTAIGPWLPTALERIPA